MIKMTPEKIKILATRKKASSDFEILDTYEAGLVLTGSEVKSLRTNSVTLKEGFVLFKNGEAWVVGMHIPPYKHANRQNHHPFRKRKLLLKKSEIKRISSKAKEKGITVIPVKLYFKRGYAKVEIALVRPKKKYDKRQDIKRRDARREMSRALKYKNR